MAKQSMEPESNSNLALQGRIMALDLGDKRIGTAISDPGGTIARPLTVLKRKSRVEDFEKYRQLAADHQVVLLIVGLPMLLSGEVGKRAAWTEDYASALSEYLDMEVELWDESFSTKDAEDSLRQRGINIKKQRHRIDAVAAAMILQSYLDSKMKGSVPSR